jgi:hypothetical protein
MNRYICSDLGQIWEKARSLRLVRKHTSAFHEYFIDFKVNNYPPLPLHEVFRSAGDSWRYLPSERRQIWIEKAEKKKLFYQIEHQYIKGASWY